MEEYIKALEEEFKKNANSDIAYHQRAYMKNKFEYYGIKTPVRREFQKTFFTKSVLPDKKTAEQIIKTLWLKPQREYHYFAQELLSKYQKQIEEKDIELLEFMITNNSWWDTVDFIAVTLIGNYFKKYPKSRDKITDKWLKSGNMWLQRSAVLFQLKYKKDLDTIFLSMAINSLLGSKEFFINKAIGWVLRDYSRVNPKWVVEFANKTALSNLSRREALRLLKVEDYI